ncbi:MAG: glycosyltransferase family protein [Candidatus Sericytochromatia bacterium]|nr:glycosyltransferase family protein [Candidatus Sericytochromatia bacterium]
MKIVATVEVRMGSSRLPGKAMMDVVGRPLLARVIERIRLCPSIGHIVVATTVHPDDDVIESFCLQSGVAVHRGSEEDVLQRVVDAAEGAGADLVVQFGGDSPFIDWQLVEELLRAYRSDPSVDLLTNCLTLTYPLGVYTFVVPMANLRLIALEAKRPDEREDVTRAIWEHPERWRLRNLEAPDALRRPHVRLTVDYPEDLALTRELYARLLPTRPAFTTRDVLAVLDAEPTLARINAHCVQRSAPHIPRDGA